MTLSSRPLLQVMVVKGRAARRVSGSRRRPGRLVQPLRGTAQPLSSSSLPGPCNRLHLLKGHQFNIGGARRAGRTRCCRQAPLLVPARCKRRRRRRCMSPAACCSGAALVSCRRVAGSPAGLRSWRTTPWCLRHSRAAWRRGAAGCRRHLRALKMSHDVCNATAMQGRPLCAMQVPPPLPPATCRRSMLRKPAASCPLGAWLMIFIVFTFMVRVLSRVR